MEGWAPGQRQAKKAREPGFFPKDPLEVRESDMPIRPWVSGGRVCGCPRRSQAESGQVGSPRMRET